MRRRNARMMIMPLIAAMCITVASGCSAKKDAGKAKNAVVKAGAQIETIRVKVESAGVRQFEEKTELQGNLSAKSYANVTARIPGTITGMYVNEGDAVTAGRTKLFDVDSVKLKRAVEIGRQECAVARQTLKVAEAGLDSVDAQVKKAETDLKRISSLYEKEVVTKDTLEKVQTGYDQVVAGRKQAESAVSLSEERVKEAELALRINEKDLSDATIYAPISGRVAVRFSEVGEMAAPGMPVIRIENTSVIEASAFLPSELYAKVKVGVTKIDLNVSGIDIGSRPVSYKSPTINPKLRTFEVKSVISNPPAGVAPGAMAALGVVLSRKSAVGVPSGCIQKRGGKDVVFVFEDGKAAMRVVEKGLESEGYTEIKSGVKQGDEVITEGQNFLNDGTPVTIGGEGK